MESHRHVLEHHSQLQHQHAPPVRPAMEVILREMSVDLLQ